MSAKSPPVMIEAERSASARSAGVSSAARRWKKSRHIDSSRMERRPVAPQPEKMIRPFGAWSVLTIEPTSFSNFSPANTCRIVMGICRSPRCRHCTPASVERLKSSSSVAVIGFDCSVGRNPRWNCFSLSMKSRAFALTASEHSKAETAPAATASVIAIPILIALCPLCSLWLNEMINSEEAPRRGPPQHARPGCCASPGPRRRAAGSCSRGSRARGASRRRNRRCRASCA